MIHHLLGTGESAARYFNDNPAYINAALLHDVIEDFQLSYEDAKTISGSKIAGEVCARDPEIVTSKIRVK